MAASENLGNDFTTTLASAITDGVSVSILVTSGTGAPAANFRIIIDSELMLVTSKGAGTNWTVTRGIEGSTAVSHLNTAPVAHVLTKGGLDQYFLHEQGNSIEDTATGENIVVPVNKQLIIHDALRLDGDLRVDGTVVVI